MVFSHGHVSDARCTGTSSDKSCSLLAAPAYSKSACPNGRCCALAPADNRVVYVARKANGAPESLRFSATLKCTRPTRFHAGFRRFRNSCTPHLDSDSSTSKAASSSPPQSVEHAGGEILRADHGRCAQRHALEFLLRGGMERARASPAHRHPAGCRARRRSARRIRANRNTPMAALSRLRPRQEEGARGPSRVRTPAVDVAPARHRGEGRYRRALAPAGRAG